MLALFDEFVPKPVVKVNVCICANSHRLWMFNLRRCWSWVQRTTPVDRGTKKILDGRRRNLKNCSLLDRRREFISKTKMAHERSERALLTTSEVVSNKRMFG